MLPLYCAEGAEEGDAAPTVDELRIVFSFNSCSSSFELLVVKFFSDEPFDLLSNFFGESKLVNDDILENCTWRLCFYIVV